MIRKIIEKDLPHLEAVDEAWDESTARKYFSKLAFIGFVSVTEERINGFIIGYRLADEAEIIQISVAKSYQRQGIGTALLNAFCAACPQSIFLEVDKNNHAAVNLYTKAKFIPIGERKDYYDNKTTALRMRLDINPHRD